jgi:ubiquinone biosynthesis protein UbiJ
MMPLDPFVTGVIETGLNALLKEDIVAHTLVSGVKGSACWIKKQVTRQTRHAAEVLTEEWKIAPPPLEVAYFCDQVSDVEKHLAQLDARLTQLLQTASMERA